MSPTPENLQMANYAFDEGARIANLVRHEYLKQIKNNNPEKNSEQKFGGFQALIRRDVIAKNTFKASQEQIKEACSRVRSLHPDLFEAFQANSALPIREAISHCITAVLVFSTENLQRAIRSHKNARKLITKLRDELQSIMWSHRRQVLDNPSPRSSKLKNCTIKMSRDEALDRQAAQTAVKYHFSSIFLKP